MTYKRIISNKASLSLLTQKTMNLSITLILLSLTLMLNIFLSDEIANSVRTGLSLCTNIIIPAVFPFIILSDYISAYSSFSSLTFAGRIFETIFHINRSGLYAFITGLLLGFPLGVRNAVNLYKEGKISANECERLIGFCNNTGPAFLISGVGMGLRNSISFGFILYISMVLSAVVVGILFRTGKNSISISNGSHDTKESFDLITSIKTAGQSTLNICAFLTFFSIICGLMKKLIGISPVYLILISFVEIGSASSILSKVNILSYSANLALSAFAVGFSGLCVHMQAAYFIKGTDISMTKYYFMKICQVIICAGLAVLIGKAVCL